MTNEAKTSGPSAAERLLRSSGDGYLRSDGWTHAPAEAIREALAAERRTGADEERKRIRAALPPVLAEYGWGEFAVIYQEILAILDAEAAR